MFTPDGVPATSDPTALTPVIERNGLWFKREDAFRMAIGVNGSKLRACEHLVNRAHSAGKTTVVSAASVLSPQSPMGAVWAREYGMDSVTIVGGTTPDKAVRHQSVALAWELGSIITSIPVGYNPALQSAARKMVQANDGYWRLPYGITTEDNSSLEDIRAFVEVGAAQAANLPDGIEHLVLPFGSGNTAAGVLYGMLTGGWPDSLRTIHMMTIGPDRWEWLNERLGMLGCSMTDFDMEDVEVERHLLHPHFATYGDRMPETLEGIDLHPTYEGKIARYLNQLAPDWWTARDGKTLFWIVGGKIEETAA